MADMTHKKIMQLLLFVLKNIFLTRHFKKHVSKIQYNNSCSTSLSDFLFARGSIYLKFKQHQS